MMMESEEKVYYGVLGSKKDFFVFFLTFLKKYFAIWKNSTNFVANYLNIRVNIYSISV